MLRHIVIVTVLAFSTWLSLAQEKSCILPNGLQNVILPNGWKLSPAGRSLPLGDLPLNIAVSGTQKLLAVTNNGQGIQTIQLIDPRTETILDHVVIGKSWYGLKFSADEKFLYASGGNDNCILKYAIKDHKLSFVDSIVLGKKWPEKISPAGIDIDEANHILYVVTKENNSLYLVDLRSKHIIEQIPLQAEAYACLLSKNKEELFISLWGGDKVLVFKTGTHKMEQIGVGHHPNEIISDKKNNYLYVANANDNSVSIIDIKKKQVVEVLNAALFPNAPSGSTTNGLALSANEKRLYIANADNNCLAVFDVSQPGRSISAGFIPTGWYPTNVKVIGTKIFVANGKGFTSFANPNGPNPINRNRVAHQKGAIKPIIREQYIGSLMKGTMSIIDEPKEKLLATYSRAVYKNTPYNKDKEVNAEGEPGNPIPSKVGAPSPIKYVFYIIKENRTYDQVLGDMKEGNGDTSLVLFGEKITPNQHRLAKAFVLFDNFYVDGEVSADGHNWSTAANATDYLEKTWPTSYGDRGGNYDAEGNREIANPRDGFIWDYCKRAGISYRTYGEFVDNFKANIPVLKDHFCPYFTSWDQKVRDTTRFNQWRMEFDSLVAINAVPKFNSLRFINDHTEGSAIGRPTPFAHVADNDWAVGKFIEYLSTSPIWKESVVFILEDDAQNGPDHVDAHRSPVYVAGPYVKRNFVDHTPYSTSSVLRTLELILGLPPMSQYDAGAMPMWRSFTATPDISPFTSLSENIDLREKNNKNNPGALKSMGFDFSKEDMVPDQVFNEDIWKTIKGQSSSMPAPRRSAFLKNESENKKNKGADR